MSNIQILMLLSLLSLVVTMVVYPHVLRYARHFNVGNNPDYQYAYHIFRKQLSDGKHRKELFKLTMSHFMAKAAWLIFD